MKRIVLALALTVTPAFAQQPQQQTPSQVALQLSAIIGQWAQGLEALQKQNAELQQKLDTITKERDDLKSKAEPAKQ